jgi:eukaryotic-like serine/threonine-protein kinase
MVRRADELFLAIAVKNELLEKNRARTILNDLKDLASRGTPRKARHVCLEQGLLTNKIAKKVKLLVMEQLAAEQVTRKKARKRIGGYKLGKQLNATRLGVLYRAEDKSGAAVLLKVLGDPLLNSGSVKRQDYFKALKKVTRLGHMSLVPLLDCGEDQDTAYVVLEDVKGEALSRKIRLGKLLDERDATRLALALTEVLKEAAGQDLLHGLLNPAMILYDEGGPRLMDLGVMPQGVKTRTLEEAAHRAPETLNGAAFDLRADIYSLGATLYQSVTGRLPFDSVDAIRFDPLTSLEGLNPKLSVGFCQLVEAMLARKVEQRYQSYEALISDLDNVIAGFTPTLELGIYKASKPARIGGREKGGLKRSTRKGPAIASKDRGSLRRRGRVREDPDDGLEKTSPMLPVAALGIAAVVFLAAVFFLGGSKKPSKQGKKGPVVANNNGKETAEDYLETAAQKAYDQALTFKYWDRLEKFEDLVNNYAKTRIAAKVRNEAENLRRNLEAEELKGFNTAKLRIDGLKTAGEWLKAIAEFETLTNSLRGKRLLKSAQKELAALKKARLEQLKNINSQASQLARSQRYKQAIQVLKESMGLRDEADRKNTRVRITSLEAKLAGLLSKRARNLRIKSEKAVTRFEGSLKERGQEAAFDLILREGNALLGALDTDSDRDLIRRVELHVKAAKGLRQLSNMVSSAALDLVGKDLEIQQVRGGQLKGQLIEVDGDGGLILEVRGGELTITRDKLSLESQEYILLKADKSNNEGLLLVGLRWIYWSRVNKGLKRLLRAQKKGNSKASYFIAARKDYRRIFGGEKEASSPDPVVKKEPDTKKTPDKKKADIEPVAMQEIYDNLRLFYISASEVGFSLGRTDAIYDFFSGAKKLNNKDWNEGGRTRKIYPSSERQAIVLEGVGSVFHKVVLAKEFTLRVRFSYNNSLVKRSGIRLVIVDQKKKEEYRSLYGQQIFHYKKGRLRRREGLASFSQDLLKPKAIHKLEIGYKNGEVWTKLNGEQHGLIKGAGISKARVGITWDKMSINLHSVRIEGFLDDEFARKRIDDKDKSDKKKRRKP